MNKYKNIKSVKDNITFASKKEMQRYSDLKLLEKDGKIRDLKIQPSFILQPTFKKNGKTIRSIKYIADFQYYDVETDDYVVEDVKGFSKKKGYFTTSVFEIKRKMFEYRYPKLTIRLV